MKSSALTELLIASLNLQLALREMKDEQESVLKRMEEGIQGVKKAIELMEKNQNES